MSTDQVKCPGSMLHPGSTWRTIFSIHENVIQWTSSEVCLKYCFHSSIFSLLLYNRTEKRFNPRSLWIDPHSIHFVFKFSSEWLYRKYIEINFYYILRKNRLITRIISRCSSTKTFLFRIRKCQNILTFDSVGYQRMRQHSC